MRKAIRKRLEEMFFGRKKPDRTALVRSDSFQLKIEKMREIGHPMLDSSDEIGGEIETLAVIIRHQLSTGPESIQQIKEMLYKSGSDKETTEKILKLAQAA